MCKIQITLPKCKMETQNNAKLNYIYHIIQDIHKKNETQFATAEYQNTSYKFILIIPNNAKNTIHIKLIT